MRFKYFNFANQAFVWTDKWNNDELYFERHIMVLGALNDAKMGTNYGQTWGKTQANDILKSYDIMNGFPG